MEMTKATIYFGPLPASFLLLSDTLAPVFIRWGFIITVKAYTTLRSIVYLNALFTYGALSAMK
tara:strand:+ start:685 stop:873 length:189 start_codon:yes stop_codon:yes gene_type:complete